MAGFLLLVLGGCETTSVKDGWDSITDSVGGYLPGSDRTKNLEGRLIDKVENKAAATKPLPDADELARSFREDINYMRYGNRTVADLPELESYLNSVLETLRNSWQGQQVPVTVRIMPSPGFAAYTLEHGTIFISIGALVSMKNEDQLAALLGHEYAHRLLKHHVKDTLMQTSDFAMRSANLYVSNSQTVDVQSQTQKLKIASWVSDRALFPSWNRGQENEADFLGVDLLVRSGYSADAMVSMLKMVSDSVDQQIDYIRKNKILEGDEIQQPSGMLTDFLDLNALVAEGATQLDSELSRDYETIKERNTNVRDYLRREYADRERKAMKTGSYQSALGRKATRVNLAQYESAFNALSLMGKNASMKQVASAGSRAVSGSLSGDPYTRMVMYRIHIAQGRKNDAITDLEKAYRSGGAPMETYQLLADNAMGKGELQNAMKYYQEIDSSFDKPVDILPDMIKINKRLGNSTISYELRCFASVDSALINLCNQAKNM